MNLFSKIKNLYRNSASDISIEDDSPESWYSMAELAERLKNSASSPSALYSVGTVFACVNYRARMLSKLPFQVFHKEITEKTEQRSNKGIART